MAQVGKSAKVYERDGNREWRHWDMPSYAGIETTKVYLARMFEDGAVVCMTTDGMVMVYHNLQYPDRLQRTWNNKPQSTWFDRQGSQEVVRMRQLLAELEKGEFEPTAA